MFENDAEIDFGEEFTVNFKQPQTTQLRKRQLIETPVEPPKKAKLPKNVVKRKFPGPAGILPERVSGISENLNLQEPEEITCSQMSVSIFQTSPWTDLVNDHEKIINSYNIAWLKDNATLNKLPNKKVPYLAVYIKNIECYEGKNPIVKVLLKDVSGEIQGTILHNLYEEYSNSLVPGSVIVLRQCGVLTSLSNNHYLTVLQKNLIKIYWKTEDKISVINVQDCDLDEPKKEEKKEIKFEISNSQLTIKGSQEEVDTWKEAFDGIDMSSFFEDF